MPAATVEGVFHSWARELLGGCNLPETRNVDTIWLFEPSCICFTARGVFSRRSRARTALLKEGVNGPVVYRVIEGWPLTFAGIVYQGPLTSPERVAYPPHPLEQPESD